MYSDPSKHLMRLVIKQQHIARVIYSMTKVFVVLLLNIALSAEHPDFIHCPTDYPVTKVDEKAVRSSYYQFN